MNQVITDALARLVTAVENAGSHFESDLPDAMAAARTALTPHGKAHADEAHDQGAIEAAVVERLRQSALRLLSVPLDADDDMVLATLDSLPNEFQPIFMDTIRELVKFTAARPAERDGTRAELDATRRVLAAMVNQYMAFPEGFISHEFMSAQEDAIELLEHIGWLTSGPLERYYWTDAARAAMVGDTVIPRTPGGAT